MHAYLPGWEVPKMRPEYLTNQYGFIVDYLAEFLREMRKRNFSDAINRYFKLGNNLNQRDTIAVKRTASGLLKLIYPHGDYDEAAVQRCLQYALESRRRVKEQLKKIGGMEFYDVHFSYIENESLEEKFVSLPEQGGDKLIPEGSLSPGTLHTVAPGTDGMLGLYRLELQVTAGSGKLSISGVGSNSASKESIRIAFDYFKANIGQITSSVKAGDFDYHLHTVELNNTGATENLTVAALVSLCSGLMKKPVIDQAAILGGMSLGGNIIPVTNLAETLQVAFDAGAKRILLPMSSVGDIARVPGELFTKFQTSFYATPADAVFKSLGVD
jgi:ATP-dependent Lon protease